MTNGEKNVLHHYLNNCTNLLEFGSGESTIYASSIPSLNSIISVESSREFINEHLLINPTIASALTSGKLFIHYVDIGETVEWGYPKDNSKKHLWPNYSLSPFCQKKNYDLFLIDGRFRVACTLNCILNSEDTSTIILHDFWNRPEYYFLQSFLKLEDKVDTLAVFKKKEPINRSKIQKLIKTYQYLPSDKSNTQKILSKIARLIRSSI